MQVSSDLQEKIDIVCRQTDYTQEKALEKLTTHNNNTIDVIKEYLGSVTTEKKQPKTLNQKIYSEIRTFMDNVNTQYELRKQESTTH